jgi:hypothetical protein
VCGELGPSSEIPKGITLRGQLTLSERPQLQEEYHHPAESSQKKQSSFLPEKWHLLRSMALQPRLCVWLPNLVRAAYFLGICLENGQITGVRAPMADAAENNSNGS